MKIEQEARDMCGTILNVAKDHIAQSGLTSEEAQNVVLLRYLDTFPVGILLLRSADIKKGIGSFRKKDKALLLRVQGCLQQKIDEKQRI